MARMMGLSGDVYVGCCNACTKSKNPRRRPAKMLRHIQRQREKRQWRREL